MLQRTSFVDTIKVAAATFASTVQLGDSCIINGFSRALAVQREAEIFYTNEGNFSAYPVFTEAIPFQPITEAYSFLPHHTIPAIKVNHVNIIAISSSSILHVGNSQNISMETRVKHIRHLLPKHEEQ